MELSQILNSLSNTGSVEKTASARRGSSLEDALDRALNEPLTKTASVRANNNSPVADLTKIAAKLATAEQEALIKEAELYGAAVCDGFMSRMHGYEASGSGVKVASYQENDYDSDMAKIAMELGYQETKAELEKIASAAYNDGYSSVVNSVGYNQQMTKEAHIKLASGVKLASDRYAKAGYKAAMSILANMR
jgi:hypothetical protein